MFTGPAKSGGDREGFESECEDVGVGHTRYLSADLGIELAKRASRVAVPSLGAEVTCQVDGDRDDAHRISRTPSLLSA